MNFNTLVPIIAILVSVGFMLMGNGFQGTLLPLRADFEDFSALSIGILGSSYFVGFVLGCVFVPAMVRAVGHIRTFTALVALASAVTLAHALFVTPVAWWVLRGITGFAFAGLYMIIESWLNERATSETRGSIMGIYMVVNLGVITVGQMLVVVYAPEKFEAFALASILISLAALPIAFTKTEQPQTPPKITFKPLQMYKNSPAAYMGCFVVGVGNGATWSLVLLYATSMGLGVEYSALFFSLIMLGGALVQYPVGKLSDKMDRRAVLAVCQIGAAGISLLLAFLVGLTTLQLMALGVVLGMFMLPGYSLAAAHGFDHAEPEKYVQISAGLLLVNGAGSIVGPIMAAALMGWFGHASLFLFTAVCQALLALYLVGRMLERRAPKQKQKEDFTLENAAPITPVPFTISDEFRKIVRRKVISDKGKVS